MGEMNYTEEEKQLDSYLDLDDEALGLHALHCAIILCELPDGGVNHGRGIEKASAVLGGLVCDCFEGNPVAFNLELVNKLGEVVTFCTSIGQGKLEELEKQFSAVIDGKRVDTDDGEDLKDRMEDSDHVTELTIQFRKEQ